MPWHVPSGLRPSRVRVCSGLFFTLLAIAQAMPHLATASHKSPKKPVRVPDCAHFSVRRMAELIDQSSLELEGTTPGGNACTYKGPRVPGRYSDLFQVSVQATAKAPVQATGKALFARVKRYAKKLAAERKHFTDFFCYTVKIDGAVAALEVVRYHYSASLGPCRGMAPLPEFGPPTCKGQPGWETTTVYTYGALKPNGPAAFVAVGLAGQANLLLNGVDQLNKEIMSGQIR
jgi:hypothetical protein